MRTYFFRSHALKRLVACLRAVDQQSLPAFDKHVFWVETQTFGTKTALPYLKKDFAPHLDNVSEHPQEHGSGAEEDSRGERLRSSYAADSSSPTSATTVSAATGPAGSSPEEVATGPNDSGATPTTAKSSGTIGEPLRWWLEIVGAGEVTIETLISLQQTMGYVYWDC